MHSWLNKRGKGRKKTWRYVHPLGSKFRSQGVTWQSLPWEGNLAKQTNFTLSVSWMSTNYLAVHGNGLIIKWPRSQAEVLLKILNSKCGLGRSNQNRRQEVGCTRGTSWISTLGLDHVSPTVPSSLWTLLLGNFSSLQESNLLASLWNTSWSVGNCFSTTEE